MNWWIWRKHNETTSAGQEMSFVIADFNFYVPSASHSVHSTVSVWLTCDPSQWRRFYGIPLTNRNVRFMVRWCRLLSGVYLVRPGKYRYAIQAVPSPRPTVSTGPISLSPAHFIRSDNVREKIETARQTSWRTERRADRSEYRITIGSLQASVEMSCQFDQMKRKKLQRQF